MSESWQLCGWDDVYPDSAGPIVASPWYVSRERDALMNADGGVRPGTADDVLADARRGQATSVLADPPVVRIPDGVLVLVPPEADDPLREAGHASWVTVTAPEPGKRRIRYLARPAAERLLRDYLRAYLSRAARHIGRGDLHAAGNALTLALGTGPTMPHPFLLIVEVMRRRDLLRGDDDEFARHMHELARELLVEGADPAKLGADLFALTRLAYAPHGVSSLEILRFAPGLMRELLQAVPLAAASRRILDDDRRAWRYRAQDLRGRGRFDEARSADQVVLALTERLCEKLPANPMNHFHRAATLERIGDVVAAADAARDGLEREPDAKLSDRYDYVSSRGDALKIIGRARFLRRIPGDAPEKLTEAIAVLRRARRIKLGADLAIDGEVAFVDDRLATCYLYLGIAQDLDEHVATAVAIYERLIAKRPSSSMRLLLCDAFVALRRWDDALAQLRALGSLGLQSTPHVRKRFQQVIYARKLSERAPLLDKIVEMADDHVFEDVDEPRSHRIAGAR